MAENSYPVYGFASRKPQLDEPESGTSYGGFPYQSAYGPNPFTSALNKINKDVDTTRDSVTSMKADAEDKFQARLDDPEVKDYLANALSGQRTALDEYVRRAAGASVRRGGINVAGAPDLGSSLHHDAMKTLAAGYGQRLGDAMNFDKYLKSAQYGQYTDSIRNLQNLLGLQQSLISNQAGWQDRLGTRQQEDWRTDVDWDRGQPDRTLARAGQLQQLASNALAQDPRQRQTLLQSSSPAPASQPDPARALQLELLRQQLGTQHRRSIWEQQDRQRALDDMLVRGQQWGQTQVIQATGPQASSAKRK